MRFSHLSIAPLLGITLLSPFSVVAQETPNQGTQLIKPQPSVELETAFGKPQVKMLKVEDEPNRHYEKWREKVLVVFAFIAPSSPTGSFVTKSLTRPEFNLQLQANQKKAGFSQRFAALKNELNAIDSPEPHLKQWSNAKWTSKGESTIPQQNIHIEASCPDGRVIYTWLEREVEMEGVHIGKKTMVKAELTVRSAGVHSLVVRSGETFNMETGEVEKQKH